MAFSERFGDYPSITFKILIGLGISVIAVSLMFFVSDETGNLTHSVYLQAAMVGLVLMVFAYLAWKMFDRM